MKKISKVLLLIAIVSMIALPLSAAKTMTVTWQWLLNDPYVTSYRYQLDGEAEDGWTVVGANTDKLVAEGLDPYTDHTLFLQCTYDGVIWSDSAMSTAKALLVYEEAPTVKETPVVEEIPIVEEAPVVEEVKGFSGSAVFDVFGYEVENSWDNGVFVAKTTKSGILSESDVRGFALYEVDKYGKALTESVSISFIPDGLELSYPESIDPSLYISLFQSDILEYISTLDFSSPEKVKEDKVGSAEGVVEEVKMPQSESFSVFGFEVENSWMDGKFTSKTAKSGLLSESDVRGFAQYEVKKYGESLVDYVAIDFVKDGFELTYPESIDPSLYISQYRSDIEEYVLSLGYTLTLSESKDEKVEKKEEVETVEVEKTPETATFLALGFEVESSWMDGKFTSKTTKSGLLSESDVRGFAQYEVKKYGQTLVDYVSINFIEDGFELTYPESIDPSLYIPQYRKDIEEYGNMLLASAVVEKDTAEAPVEEAKAEEVEVPSAPETPEVVDVPEPAEVVEVIVSPKVEKLSSYKFKLGLSSGAEFGITNADSVVTILPRFAITADFQNVISASRFGMGLRLDAAGVFKPLDGTFAGHDFNYFLSASNWNVDLTVDAKLMAYLNFKNAVIYAGGGAGYSLASAGAYPSTHTSDAPVFGFDTAPVITAVAGIDLKLGSSAALYAEFVYRNFFKSTVKAQSLNGVIGLAFTF